MKWPEDYENWSGDLTELVKTSNKILKELKVEAKPVSTRVLRHYQQNDLVGRGIKQGKKSIFDYNDLTKVIATKQLVNDGWTLNHTANFMARTAELPSNLSPATINDIKPSSGNAIALIDTLMSNSLSPSVSQAYASTTLPFNPGVQSSNTASFVEKYGSVNWLDIYINNSELMLATNESKNQAIRELENLINRLKRQ